MATPPTFVAEYGDVWNSTATPKTASVTVTAGDILVVVGVAEEANTFNTPTGGGLTYTLQQAVNVAAYTGVSVWTAPCASSQTFTLSLSTTDGRTWGFNSLRFSGSAGAGTSNKTNVSSGAPSLGLTTGGDNSAIVCVVGDWNAVDGASRTWRTVNGITPTSGNGLEVSYFRDSTRYTVYAAYWNDGGTAGAKTVGISAPSGQKYSIAAIEILGVAGSAPAFPPSQQVRRRLGTAPRLPRGSARISTPVRAQVNPPFPFTGVKQPRRLRGISPRRGKARLPVPPQVVVAAPTFPVQPVREHLRGLRLFRPRAGSPVPAQITPVAPAFPPRGLRARVRGLRLFRPRVAPSNPRRQAVPPAVTHPRPRAQLRLRGRVVVSPPPQVVVAAPAYPPRPVRARPKGLRLGRGRASTPVPAQVTVVPPAFPPRGVRARIKALRWSRGRGAAPVPPQVIVAPPARVPLFARLKQHAVRLTRGRFRSPQSPGVRVLPMATASPLPPLVTGGEQRPIRTVTGDRGITTFSPPPSIDT